MDGSDSVKVLWCCHAGKRSLATPDANNVLWVEGEFVSRLKDFGVEGFVIKEASNEPLVGTRHYRPHVLGVVGFTFHFERFAVVEDEFYHIAFTHCVALFITGYRLIDDAMIFPVSHFDGFEFVAFFFKCGIWVWLFAHSGL